MNTLETIFPDKYIFTINIPVRIYDINYGNHLGHDSLVSILHESRIAFLKQHQLSELDIFGIGWIISNLNIAYKNQAFHGDILTISLAIQNITKTGFEFIHAVKMINHNGKEINIADASTKMIFFDYKTNKIQKIPSEFLEIINTLGHR